MKSFMIHRATTCAHVLCNIKCYAMHGARVIKISKIEWSTTKGEFR